MTIDGKREQIDSFPIASTKIQELMHQLLEQINACKALSEKLFQVEFQTSRNQDSMRNKSHLPQKIRWKLGKCSS